MVDGFQDRGFVIFPPEPAVLDWVSHALLDAQRALTDPGMDHWYQCERTWFIGLDALDSDPLGRVGGSNPLSGRGVDFAEQYCGGWPELHPAQLSGVFPGYPQPREGETESAFRYRLKRDAAHVDGVIGEGTPKRRFVQEPHSFILGVQLTQADEAAAPLVVWEGSHRVMLSALRCAFDGASGDMSRVDVTEIYQKARREVFDSCKRATVFGAPGSVYVLHRAVLHGVAPWEQGARADPLGRLIAYFRPPMPGGSSAWARAD